MSDSLVIGNVIELLGGGVPSTLPLAAGAIYHLSPGWDLSAPQPAADTVATLLLGGGLPIGENIGNRVPKLPITIVVPSTGNEDADRQTLAGAREMLMLSVNADRWSLVWTREGGYPLLLDCFHAAPAVVTYSMPMDIGLISQIEISFEALPYGKSDTAELVPFNSPSTLWVAPPASVVIDDFQTIDNWLNGDDTGFEASTGHWTAAGGCNIAQTTAQAHTGTGSLQVTANSTSNMDAASAVASAYATLGLPCVVNDTVTVSAWFRAATVARTCQTWVAFFDQSGNQLSTVFSAGTADTTTGWTQVTGNFTAPALTAYAIGKVQINSPAGSGEVHYVDDVNVNRGAIFSLTDIALFSQSTKVAVGTHSVHWARTDNNCPNYTHQLPSPLNITGLKKLSLWMGLGTGTYSTWHTGRVTVSVTLTDGTTGATVTMTTTVTHAASGLITAPRWQKVSGWIPQNTVFDYTNVVQYELKAWNKVGLGGVQILQAEAYFDHISADAASTGAPGPRGAVYAISGTIGTAPSALTLQLQPGPSTVQSTAIFTTAGSNNWTAPTGVTLVLKAEAIGGGSGGAGGGAVANTGGGGGAGGEYAAEYNIPVTPATVYHPTVGAAGTAGNSSTHTSGPGGDSFFFGDGGFGVYAHGAGPAAVNGTMQNGALGGRGSNNSVHYNGGNGRTGPAGQQDGNGAGGSGGYASAGKSANEPQGSKLEWEGAAAVDGGGPGGNGGVVQKNSGLGNAPSGPYGGGGGGGAPGANGGPGQSGWVKLTWASVAASPLKTAIVHLPRRDAPSSIAPFTVTGNGTDTPNGLTTYTAPVTGSLQARYDGTYQVILTNFSWNAPTTSRTITLTIIQHKADGTTPSVTLTRTFIPNTDPDHVNLLNGLVLMGTVTLPLYAISPGNNTDTIQFTVNDTNTSDRFLDTLLLDVTGQTVIYSSSASGVNNLWVTEPDLGIDIGQVYGSQNDWDQASSVMYDVPVISGGPMAVLPGENPFFCYSVQGAPALQASYLPRWNLDRLQ